MMCTSLSQIEALWPFMRDPYVGAARLAALGPRLRRIVQRQLRAALWRHARIDDGKPVPGEIARTIAICARCGRHYLKCCQGIRAPASAAGELTHGAAELLRRPRLDVLCRRQPAGAAVAGTGGAGKTHLRPRHSDDHDWGLTEPRPDHHLARPKLAPGNIGIPMPGLELKLVPHPGQARGAGARTERDDRLLERAGGDGSRVRRKRGSSAPAMPFCSPIPATPRRD